jgi:hypothetical protein
MVMMLMLRHSAHLCAQLHDCLESTLVCPVQKQLKYVCGSARQAHKCAL